MLLFLPLISGSSLFLLVFLWRVNFLIWLFLSFFPTPKLLFSLQSFPFDSHISLLLNFLRIYHKSLQDTLLSLLQTSFLLLFPSSIFLFRTWGISSYHHRNNHNSFSAYFINNNAISIYGYSFISSLLVFA